MSMNQDQIFDTIKKLAKNNKIDKYDVIYQSSNGLGLKAEKGAISEFKKSNTQTLGIRVVRDQKVGISYTEACDKDSIDQCLKMANEYSLFSKIDSNQEISAPKIELIDEAEINNHSYSPSTNELVEKCLYLESEVYKREKLTKNSPYNGVGANLQTFSVFNSNDVKCHFKTKRYSCYTSALLSDGINNSTHYLSDTNAKFNDLDIEKCINESIYGAKYLLSANPISSGKYSVMWSLDLLEDLFDSFMLAFSARAVIDKTNPWSKNLGSNVCDKSLTIIDSPFIPGGVNNTIFDSEGFSKKENILVEHGELKQFLHNSATASELMLANNFCAQRGARSGLSAGYSNLVIKGPGTHTQGLNEMRYIEITKAQGLHSGVNAISGDFSLGVSGIIHNLGEIEGYFKDVTVSGNFYEMIKNVEFIGKNLEASNSKALFAPKIIFKDLFIAGK